MSEETVEPTCNKSKMGKAIVYSALIIVCLGVGVLIGGLGLYYGRPYYESRTHTLQTNIEAKCYPRVNSVGSLPPSEGEHIKGHITLTQTSDNLKITVFVTGLPNAMLGFHVHTNGVVDNNCTSAGGHFNPHNKAHGGPQSLERHLGDLGNIDASKLPVQEIMIADNLASLVGENSILGRSIVIHEKEDDLVNMASAGGRIACCTIQR